MSVAEKELTAEEAAGEIINRWWNAGVINYLHTPEHLKELITAFREAEERGAAREREACAETAREYFKREYSFFKPTSADRLADVILARSHTKESQ